MFPDRNVMDNILTEHSDSGSVTKDKVCKEDFGSQKSEENVENLDSMDYLKNPQGQTY